MRQHRLLGGILLVSGTTIGVGMLAFPVVSSVAGFTPSLFLFIAVWLFMTFTALLFLEVIIWMKKESNLISMAKFTLGSVGAAFSWMVYLFLLYSLITAYLSMSGNLLESAVKYLFGMEISHWTSHIPFLLIFGTFVYLGTRFVDHLNRILMVGLVVSYILLVLLTPPHVRLENLAHTDWSGTLLALSVVVTAFGYHIIIPSLYTYLEGNIKRLRLAILIGSMIPLVIYIVWEFLVQGTIPATGSSGLIELWCCKAQVVTALEKVVGVPWIVNSAYFFSFFAITTSFLGVSLSLADFLSDFFHTVFGVLPKKTHLGKIAMCLLTFAPPLIFSILYPGIFFTAIEYAGAFGVVILLGILPALMVWSGRYFKRLKSPYRALGGKTALIIAILFSCFVTAVTIAETNGWLNFITEKYTHTQANIIR